MKVALYIYVDTKVNASVPLTVDTTLYSVDNTNITSDATTTIQTINEITPRRIELFEDEKISVTSSIQNINDISKVFTDYSQSFTIPASAVNNEIFRHWYENALDNGFDQRLRYDGYIEIDTQVFRTGKWQIEGASVKNNRVENYKLTFYGNLKSMLDSFGEDKLKDVETLNDYTITYSGLNVANRIKSTTDQDVLFPLISSNRVWQYGVGGSDDISNSSTPMLFSELAPALKLSRVFNAIESKYGISFNGNFLTQSRFNSAYLWLKNKEVFTATSAPTRVNLTTIVQDDSAFITYNTANDTYIIDNGTTPSVNKLFYASIGLSVSTTWLLTVFKDGVNYINYSGDGNTINVNLPQEDAEYYLTIQTGTSCNYTGTLYGAYDLWDDPFGYFQWITYANEVNVSGSTNSQLDLTQYVPDIKVSDFVSGVLKMFNLTAFSFDETNYTLEQLENWYYQGRIKDYSQYTVTDFDYERIKPYKKITFQYEKSESLMNRAFYDNAAREYGNLEYPFNTDGSDYSIKLPFENLLFNKFTGTSLQVAYSINKDLKPYIPKPVILYRLGTDSCNFQFNDGTSTGAINLYNIFGQDTTYQGATHSLNWGIEISSYYLQAITNSLFNNYYLAYLSNLYSLKSRMVKVTMRLPYSEMLSLRLNDRIVIRDKRYIINQYTTDFDTFETKMELIQDFRSILFGNNFAQTINSSAQIVRFDTVSEEPLMWNVQQDLDGQIIAINTFDEYVEIETKANTSGVDLFYSIESNLGDVIVITQNG